MKSVDFLKEYTYSKLKFKRFFINFLVMAASAIANIVKSSLGPLGLDKMLVDDIGVSNSLKILSIGSFSQLFDKY